MVTNFKDFVALRESAQAGVIVPLQYEDDYSHWLNAVENGLELNLSTFPLNDLYWLARKNGSDWRDLYAAIPHVEDPVQTTLESAAVNECLPPGFNMATDSLDDVFTIDKADAVYKAVVAAREEPTIGFNPGKKFSDALERIWMEEAGIGEKDFQGYQRELKAHHDACNESGMDFLGMYWTRDFNSRIQLLAEQAYDKYLRAYQKPKTSPNVPDGAYL